MIHLGAIEKVHSWLVYQIFEAVKVLEANNSSGTVRFCPFQKEPVKYNFTKKPNVRKYSISEFDQIGDPPIIIHRVLAGVAILLDQKGDW